MDDLHQEVEHYLSLCKRSRFTYQGYIRDKISISVSHVTCWPPGLDSLYLLFFHFSLKISLFMSYLLESKIISELILSPYRQISLKEFNLGSPLNLLILKIMYPLLHLFSWPPSQPNAQICILDMFIMIFFIPGEI